MLKRLVAGALFAGLTAGALGALLQLTFVVPLIHWGELYESGALVHAPEADGGHEHAPGTAADHDHAAEGDAAAAAPPEVPFDLSRTLATFGMFLVTFTGFALVMVAGFGLAERFGHRVTARSGLVWGLAGFVAVQLAPAFGLAPELPGSSAAPLADRQMWWALCVAATTGGLGLLAFGRQAAAIGLGLLLVALPHLIGAPQAPFGGGAPPELSGLFATRVLGAGAASWALLGCVAGAMWARGAAPIRAGA